MPFLGKNIIQRVKITAEIERLSKRGILFVHSPAGYGKTTAVTLWARKKKTAWLSLDEYSCKPAEIYKMLLLALSAENEVSENFDNSPLEYTLDALQKTKDFPDTVVIDDFHLCTDLAAARALPLLRSRIPPRTAFIIISRNPPPDILIDQTIKGAIQQISALQFSNDEIISLFNKNQIQITKYEAETIHRRTDGWAAALAAILLSGKDSSLDLLDSQALDNYLRIHVFNNWEDYQILKKCAICDTLYPSLCAAITSQDNAWEIISGFAAKTGLAMRTGNNTCRFHALLKEFLEAELLLDETIDKLFLYRTVAEFFKNTGEFPRAVNMAAKSKDIAMVEEYLQAWSVSYGTFMSDVAEYSQAIFKHIYTEMPASYIKQSTRLSMQCALSLFNLGMLKEAFEFLDAATALSGSSHSTQSDIITLTLLQCVDPRSPPREIPERFRKVLPLLAKAEPAKIQTVSITYNFPFFHKAQKDYTDTAPQFDEFKEGIQKYMEPAVRGLFTPLSSLLEAGVRYERGELSHAEKIAQEMIQITRQFPPELQFCALCLYAEIMRVQGKIFSLESVRTMIAQTKAHYLQSNFKAFTVNIYLHNGDEDTANKWLAQSEVEDTLKFYKIYQYFTTARSLMVTEKLSKAETLLKRLALFSTDYRRPADHIEALTLRSICLWHTNRKSDSIKVMTEAITKAHELQLVMPIIKEGGEILPILEKILTRLKYGYDTDILDRSFINTLYNEAAAISRHSGIMVKRNKNKKIKLSPRQSEILGYLGQNYSYKEIGEKLGIKFTTVNEHINKIYEKLEVSNAKEAVAKANELYPPK